MSPLPCAVYTRKSSEEGLGQGFNSLDAQREACEAYILSQKAQGWKAIGSYDDGGFSGGNVERPALKRLLADIAARRIRIVVVYKVDRLTRSLARWKYPILDHRHTRSTPSRCFRSSTFKSSSARAASASASA
jgi:DNA invertase Pin-like site-specific DNA recombinase